MSEASTTANVARTLSARWQHSVEHHGSRPALRSESVTYSYAELDHEARLALGVLHAAGVQAGDRVLMMMPNSPMHVFFWLAAGAGGIIEVPVNTEYRGEMLRYIIANSGAATMIVGEEYVDRLRDIVGSVPTVERILVSPATPDAHPASELVDDTFQSVADLRADAEPATQWATMKESDPVGVLYTSGTTGPSKGALISQLHAFEYARAAADLIDLSSDDVYYAPLPLFHIAGQWAVVYAALQRGACVFLKQKFSVQDFWSDVREGQVTTSFLLGAMAQWLHGQPDELAGHEQSLDRVLMVPLIDDVAGFASRFDLRVSTCYGSTEVNLPIMAGYVDGSSTSCGRVAPGYEVRLVDENDHEVPVGTPGELVVRTSVPFTTMIEYHERPDATAAAFRNMWLHSGDLMRRDADGNFYFVDRVTDSLRRRGENISSFEVEREVYAHPAVLECAAVAVPSPNTEDDLAVVVVPKPGAALVETELIAFLRERVARFMVPDHVFVVDALPKTPTGKIQKHVVRSDLSSQVSGLD